MFENYKLYLLIRVVGCAVIGALIWSIISIFALKGVTWLMVFAGYSAFFPGFLCGIVKLYNKN